MAKPLCLRGLAMADPHSRAPLLGVSGVGHAPSFRLFGAYPLVFGAFLEAPKSDRCDSQTIAKLSSIRTQRSLFRRILRSFDPPNTSKRRRVSSKRADRGPCRGSPAPGGDPGGSAMGWPSPCVCRARPWPTPIAGLPCWGARGSVARRRFAFSARILWFSGLFSKHRSRINVILEPLQSYLRYGHNGPCFVGFRGRLSLQTPRNVEGCRRNGLSGTLQRVPCSIGCSAMGWPSPCVCGARPWPTPIAELPCWGARGSATRRLFVVLFSLLLG